MNANAILTLIHKNGQQEAHSIKWWLANLANWDSPFMGDDWTKIQQGLLAGGISGPWSGGTWYFTERRAS